MKARRSSRRLRLSLSRSPALPGNRPGDWRLRKLAVEALEPRRLLSTSTVANADDSGAGSLRQAIIAANANSGPDTIDFGPHFSEARTINLLTALPALSDTTGGTLINGTTAPGYAGTPVVILDGGDLAITGLTVTSDGNEIRGLTIRNFDDGGIYNAGELVARNSTLSGNWAPDSGGGIYNTGGTVTISDSTLSGNSATLGGAVFNEEGIVRITNSTLSDNESGYGGAIYNSFGETWVRHSTVTNNRAQFDGGGFYNASGEIYFGHTILAENSAEVQGPDGRRWEGQIISAGYNLVGNLRTLTSIGCPRTRWGTWLRGSIRGWPPWPTTAGRP